MPPEALLYGRLALGTCYNVEAEMRWVLQQVKSQLLPTKH
jgi:hypothetical protein